MEWFIFMFMKIIKHYIYALLANLFRLGEDYLGVVAPPSSLTWAFYL